MNKLGYRQFALELTRQCNMKCLHCSRGEAQNVVMSEEILCKALDNLVTESEFQKSGKFTDAIYLYGGEPFLHPEIIHKCVNYIIEKNIFALSFWVITNGTILDESIAEDFNKITEHMKKCREIFETYWKEHSSKYKILDKKYKGTALEISWNFHDTEESRRAYEFYKEKCNDDVNVKLFDEHINLKRLSYSGRTKQIFESEDRNKYWYIIKNNHCMATNLKEDVVPKTICTSANGNVFLGLDYEYETVDSDNMGNVLDESIYDMALRWNFRYPILYSEMKEKLKWDTFIFNFEKKQRLLQKI